MSIFRKALNKIGYWYLWSNAKIWGEEPPPEDPELIKKKIEILQQQGKPITKTSIKETKIR